MEWLNQNAGAVQALSAIGILFLTLALAGATIWYARTTSRAMRLSQEQYERHWKPDLHAEVDVHNFQLVVGNLSAQPAFIRTLWFQFREGNPPGMREYSINKLVGGSSSENIPLLERFRDCLLVLGKMPADFKPRHAWQGGFSVSLTFYCSGLYLESEKVDCLVTYEHPVIRSIQASRII